MLRTNFDKNEEPLETYGMRCGRIPFVVLVAYTIGFRHLRQRQHNALPNRKETRLDITKQTSGRTVVPTTVAGRNPMLQADWFDRGTVRLHHHKLVCIHIYTTSRASTRSPTLFRSAAIAWWAVAWYRARGSTVAW